MKKLLHIGVNAGSESMPKYFREQCDYKELKLDHDLFRNLNELTASGYVPDTVFIQIQNDTINGVDCNALIGSQMRYFKSKGATVINWTGDMRNYTPQWMINFAHNVTYTMFSNQRDVDYCKALEIKTGFLQQGIDTHIFTPDGEAAYVPEIVFLANNYVNQFPLSPYRKHVVKRLRAHFGSRFRVYGNGWDGDAGNVNASQYEEAKVYRGCKIAISVSHYDSDRYFSDRLGRAMCSGAFVLSHKYAGIDKDFKAGRDLDVFNDYDEMIGQCVKYLENDDLRNEIAEAGQKIASEEFGYQNIVKQILAL